MGNSEVGHLNLGAGRVVPQDLVRINAAIDDGSFFRNEILVETCAAVRASGGTLHLAGLIGNGGVHAVDKHLFALVDLAEREKVSHVAIHALLDGRDTLPRSALKFMEETVERTKGRADVSSVGGRCHDVDRCRRCARTELWSRAVLPAVGPRARYPGTAVRAD